MVTAETTVTSTIVVGNTTNEILSGGLGKFIIANNLEMVSIEIRPISWWMYQTHRLIEYLW
jgi:uncharacterized hydantoinase/oxoprolinase family protein